MKSLRIPLFSLLLLFSVQLMTAFPLQNTAALTNEDIDVLKLLLQRLEESIPASVQDQTLEKFEEETNLEDSRAQTQPKIDTREYLTARDLMTVRKDSKRHSGCFGRKLDRIGSMSTLGCNTVGRSGPKKK